MWYGRRACARIGTQLSAAIYDKAVRIRDQSGVVSKDESHDGQPSGKNGKVPDDGKKDGKVPERTVKDKKDKSDEGEQKSGADVGKIVNLMGIDWFVVYKLGRHLKLTCLQSKGSKCRLDLAVYLRMYRVVCLL